MSRPWIAAAAAIWAVIAWIGTSAPEPIATGPYAGAVRLITDPIAGRYGPWALGEIPGGTVLVELEHPISAGRGDRLDVVGVLKGQPGIARGQGYRAVLDLGAVEKVETSRFLPHRIGRFLRERIMEQLSPFDDGRALLAGFLIGDTSRIAEVDIDAMRRSGLAHFVAVSGSNVALFLGLLVVVSGPLALGPRRRAVVSLLGLPAYAAATGFEPSVMRASMMAGLALGGRLLGVFLEAWQLLSLSVATLLVLEPALVTNVGFQLSVAATCGVLIGARWPLPRRRLRPLAITIAAQLAVAPILLIQFGSIPLLSPLVNLMAAPLVAMATVVGAVGTAGLGILIPIAAGLADLVLGLARGAAAWPQIGHWQLGLVVLAASAGWLIRRLRPVVLLAGALVVAFSVVSVTETLGPGSVVVLDVGQGDAILLHGGEGHYALVDGGPDATRLANSLRSYGVASLELVVLTHVHADHATGLTGVVGRVPINSVWADTEPHSTPASRQLFAALSRHGVPVSQPGPGDHYVLGGLAIRVEGPVRRYASPNDQSIVLVVEGGQRSMLLGGDIETFAQADLRHLRADVLKVPHQGAATSDPEWLAAVGAELAVISVGPNDFGHPEPWVIQVLEESGARVVRTDQTGDVVVNLS